MKAALVVDHGLGRSFVNGGGEVVNAYPELGEPGSKGVEWLIGVPGDALFAQLQSTGERVAAIAPAWANQAIVITDQNTFVLNRDGTWTRVGDGLTGPVQLAFNGTVGTAANGAIGIEITQTSVSQIIDADFYPTKTLDFIAGVFVGVRPGTDQYFISRPYSNTYEPQDFKTAEGSPDGLVAAVARDRELVLLGVSTTEVHGIVADAVFPFDSVQGSLTNYGCASPYSAILVEKSVIWLTNEGEVVQMAGYRPRRISSHMIEEELRELRDEWGMAFAWQYTEDGHRFYGLQVGGQTFVADLSWQTPRWAKREGAKKTTYPVTALNKVFEKTLFGDDMGRVREMGLEHLQSVDGDLPMTIGSMPQKGELEFNVSELELETIVGEGGNISIELSEDDGRTWSNQITGSLGALGNYIHQVVFNNLGSFRNMRVRVRVSGPVKKRVSSVARVEAY